MPHTYYIIDEDGEIFKTTSRKEAHAAAEEAATTVISPVDDEYWIDTEVAVIRTWAPPVDEDDEDDDIDPDDPDGEGDSE